jgi:hypothetical protein
VGAVWVPRWKWKALAFAESYLHVDALVAIVYDWRPGEGYGWKLAYTDDAGRR